MKNYLLFALLLITSAGYGQGHHKEGDAWTTQIDNCEVWHRWHNGRDKKDTICLHLTDPVLPERSPDQPRTVSAWATLQNQVNALQKQVDHFHDLIYGGGEIGRGLLLNVFNARMEVVFLHRQVDSLIKALRGQPKIVIDTTKFITTFTHLHRIDMGNGCILPYVPPVRHSRRWRRRQARRKAEVTGSIHDGAK